MSQWDKLRYVPKPGEPELPPQLAEYTNKTTDEVIQDMHKLPFFMTQLDETEGENPSLEALKSLAYEGEPDEIATNFKNQGNDCFKARKFQDAIVFYTKGLEVEHGVDSLNATLYVNRAACNLELKNYRRCIDDCKKCLQFDPENVKACFRAGKAFFAVGRYEEAREICAYGLQVDPANKSIADLDATIAGKQKAVAAAIEKKEREAQMEKFRQTILINAMNLRHFKVIKSKRPAELLEDAKIRLEDEKDHESQLIFPAMIIYPSIDEFDFVAEVSELSTPTEILELVLHRPREWLEAHKSFTVKNLQCFMETEAGGLVKVGKKAEINTALMNDKAKAPLFDNALRLYVVPKEEVDQWVKSWNKEAVLAKRNMV